MRNSLIDIAKGIGILLIVFGHNWIVFYTRGELFDFIYSFQLLLFFFLAGILYKQSNSLLPLIVSKAVSLLKPYFVVLCSLAIIKMLIGERVSLEYFLGILYANGNTIEWVPLWFLPHLFMVFIFIWFLIKGNQTLFKTSLALWLVVGIFLMIGDRPMHFFWEKPLVDLGIPRVLAGQATLPGLPFSLDIIMITSAYTLIGYLVSKQVLNFKINHLLLVISLVTFATLQYFFNDYEDLNLRIYNHVIVCAIQALTAFYSILCLSTLLNRFDFTRNIFSYIGSASLIILLFHAYIQDTVFYQLEAASPHQPIQHGAISLIVAIGGTLILNYFVKNSHLLSKALLAAGKSGVNKKLISEAPL